MKKPIFILSIVGGLLAIISLAAICTVLFVDLYQPDAPADIPLSGTTATTGQSFEEWTEEYFRNSRQAEEEAKKTTTTTQATAAETTTATTSTTTRKSWTTSITTKQSEMVTTTTTVQKTTRTATQEELDSLYRLAYNKVMAEYRQYEIEQKAYIAELEFEIDDLQDQASDLYVAYHKQLQILPEKYADMGLLHSGAYDKAVQNLENQYKADLAPLSKRIDKLEEELAKAEQDYADSKDELEEIIQEEYLLAVVEFQQKTLS